MGAAFDNERIKIGRGLERADIKLQVFALLSPGDVEESRNGRSSRGR